MSYLTNRQRDVLRFITARVDGDGVPPTLQEIADAFGFSSTASAQKHIALLERKGFLRREPHQKRGLVLLDRGQERARTPHADTALPLLGVVAAGSPIESVAGDEEVTVPAELLSPGGPHFVLRVRGDSMIVDGVLDGDLIVVRQESSARDGEMVVALVRDEVTLKRLFREPEGRIRLQPANPTIAPLRLEPSEVRVQGVVVALLRRFRS